MAEYTSNRIVLLLVVWVWVSNYAKKPDPVIPIDEQPKILTMSIPSIPQENITIDQDKHLITVILPASLPAFVLIPSFTVSQQANMFGGWGSGKGISYMDYCACTNSVPTVLEDIKEVRVVNLTHTTYYIITLKPAASLKVKPMALPIIWDSGSNYYNVNFPVENYYASSFVNRIAVTKAGSASPRWIGGGDGCFDVCSKRLNEIGISISGYRGTYALKPGLHDLDLLLLDVTIVHSAGALMVK